MKVRFKLFANFREAVRQKEVEVASDGKTVSEAVRSLVKQHPQLEPMVYQDGRLKQYVNVLLNGQTVKSDLARLHARQRKATKSHCSLRSPADDFFYIFIRQAVKTTSPFFILLY